MKMIGGRTKTRWRGALLAGIVVAAPVCAEVQQPDIKQTLAQIFGAREQVRAIHLSPDGKHAVFLSPGTGRVTFVIVIDTQTLQPKIVGRGDARQGDVVGCAWASNVRLVCEYAGTQFGPGVPMSFTRVLAVDLDGKNSLNLGDTSSFKPQYDGYIVDWGPGDGTILMVRGYSRDAGGYSGRTGPAVERVDTATGKGIVVELPSGALNGVLTDGLGNVRIRAASDQDGGGNLLGTTTWLYRIQGGECMAALFAHGAGPKGVRAAGRR